MRRRVNGRENLQEYKKGLWSIEEDNILMDYVLTHGIGQWNRLVRKTGLKRCGKSCRLRWMNYLSPNVKKGNFSEQEQDLILRLYKLLGNRWSLIAKRIPGRTDNQIKNYCNTHLIKKLVGGYSSSVKTTGDNEDSPPLLSIKTATTSSREHQHYNYFYNNTAKNFNDVDIVLDKPKPDSAQSDAMKANTYNPDDAFWINEDEFDLSSLLKMDFGFAAIGLN